MGRQAPGRPAEGGARRPVSRTFRDRLANAFAVQGSAPPLEPADEELLARLADAVVRRGMGPPAVLFLESLSPLNFIGSQALVFLRPFATAIASPSEYDRLTRILERRDAMERLLAQIEAAKRS